MRQMRILLVSLIANSRSTGMGKWTHCMAEELRADGHDVELWFAEDFGALRNYPRLSVLVAPMALAVRVLRARSRFDTIVCHEPVGFWCGILHRYLGLIPPVVAMSHGVESHVFQRLLRAARVGLAHLSPGTIIKSRLARFWQSDGFLRMANQVVCLANSDEAYLVKRLGIPIERIVTVANGVDSECFATLPAVGGGTRVLFVGGWFDTKGRRVLPALWARVKAEVPTATLSIIGAGRGEISIIEEFPESVRDSVTIHRKVESAQEMREAYLRHDLFLMPSISEGSPLSLLEAMASGLPVVVTTAGGIPDIVVHEKDALIFDTHSPEEGALHVVRLLQNPALAKALAEAGRITASQHTWRHACDAFSVALHRAVASSRDRGLALYRR